MSDRYRCGHCRNIIDKFLCERDDRLGPVPMRIPCPECGKLHIDEGEFATKPHHTHACQHCGLVWRPAIVPTVGVRFLPGFKNEPAPTRDTPPGEGEPGRG